MKVGILICLYSKFKKKSRLGFSFIDKQTEGCISYVDIDKLTIGVHKMPLSQSGLRGYCMELAEYVCHNDVESKANEFLAGPEKLERAAPCSLISDLLEAISHALSTWVIILQKCCYGVNIIPGKSALSFW